MEDTDQHVELVHVLRHSFRPSDRLQTSLEAFTKPGLARPRFLVKTLSAIALNTIDAANYHYDLPIKRAIHSFEQHHQPLQLGRDLAARRMADGTLNILFSAENRAHLKDFAKETMVQLPEGVPLDDGENPRFDLYVGIDQAHAIDFEEIVRPGTALIKGLRSGLRNLYTVIPETMTSRDEQRVIHRAIPKEF